MLNRIHVKENIIRDIHECILVADKNNKRSKDLVVLCKSRQKLVLLMCNYRNINNDTKIIC